MQGNDGNIEPQSDLGHLDKGKDIAQPGGRALKSTLANGIFDIYTLSLGVSKVLCLCSSKFWFTKVSNKIIVNTKFISRPSRELQIHIHITVLKT